MNALPEDSVQPDDRAAWRSWLAAHHEDTPGVWLVTWRKASGRTPLAYEDAVQEALCFGWVDSTARTLDDERTMLRFTPRKPGSGWARTNKDRVARLEAVGLMTDAGRRTISAAKADGSWTRLDDIERGVVPPDLSTALDRLPGARAEWDAFPPSVRRGILVWVADAKRPETRTKRVTETATMAQRGERANQARPRDGG